MIGGRVTRTTNQTTSARMTSPSDLATALAEDRLPWVCRSVGRLRLPSSMVGKWSSAETELPRTKTGSPRNNLMFLVGIRPPRTHTRIAINRYQPSQVTLPHYRRGSGWSVQGQQSCLDSIRSCFPAWGSHAMPEANRCQAVACHDGLHLGPSLLGLPGLSFLSKWFSGSSSSSE